MLCLDLLRKALPEKSSLFIAEDDSAEALKSLIAGNLPDGNSYVLIIREPAMLMKRGTVEILLETLERNPSITCVLPSDIRGYRREKEAVYFTVRGFERFVESLYGKEPLTVPYDGRSPWMFLIRASVLRQIDVPHDPLTIPGLLPSHSVCVSLNAYIHPFIDYHEESRMDAVALVPAHIRSLLDIGCARGRFGDAVKKMIGCTVKGVEMNHHEAQYAQEVLDYVYVGDFFSLAIDETFDCITCLDVIEHMTEPLVFLDRVTRLLNDGGFLLLSIPNVGHWSIVEDLLAGRWDYAPAGTLCISHLRFFTRPTIESLVHDAGLKILAIKEEISPPPAIFSDRIALLRQSGMEVDEKSLSCLGYCILLQKGDGTL